MKKLWFSLCLFFSFHCWGQSVPVIEAFSSIQLNEDKTVTITPYHPNMRSFSSREDKIILHKGEEYSFGDGRHAYGSVIYKGVKDGQLIFEEMSGFRFGGDVTEKKKEKLVFPYIKKEFSAGREAQILKRMTYNEENKEEITRLIKIVGNQNELLWWNRYNKDYVDFLLQNGADINFLDENGNTVIHNSVKKYIGYSVKDEYNTIIFLVQRGIDINKRNNEGMTIFDILSKRIKDLQQEKSTEYVSKIINDNKVLYEALMSYKNCRGIFYFDTKECYTCESVDTPKEIARELCSLCPEREIRKGICHPTQKTKECHNREGHWYMEYDHKTGAEKDCIACGNTTDETLTALTTKEECNRCKESVYFADKEKCVTCQEDWITNNYGECKPCFYKVIRSTTKEECDKCSDHVFFYDTKECVKLEGKECNDDKDCNYEGYYCKEDGVRARGQSNRMEPNRYCTKGYSCKTNKDCNNGSENGEYYCQKKDAGCIKNTCYNLAGLCQSKGKLPNSRKIGSIVTYNMGRMNWVNANNICKAHGKRLFSVEEFQCYNPKNNELIKSGDSYGLCCTKGEKCTRDSKLSSVLEELKKQYGKDFWIWTSSEANENASSLLEMLALITDYGNVNAILANMNNYYALCRE